MRLGDVRIGTPQEITDAQAFATEIVQALDTEEVWFTRNVLMGVILYIRHSTPSETSLEAIREFFFPPTTDVSATWRSNFERMLDSLARPGVTLPSTQNVIGIVASDVLNMADLARTALFSRLAHVLDRHEFEHPEQF